MKWTPSCTRLTCILGFYLSFYAFAYFGFKPTDWLPAALSPAELLITIGLVVAGCIAIFGGGGSDWRAGSDWGGDGDGGD